MEVKVELEGLPISITCTKDELGSVFEFLENRRSAAKSIAPAPSLLSSLPALNSGPLKPDFSLPIPPWTLEKILERLKGLNAAKVLKFIAEQASYTATDSQIKEALPDMTSLAPPMSQISSACKASGVNMQAFIQKQSKPSKGKLIYRFQLPEGIAKAILAIPEFTATNWN